MSSRTRGKLFSLSIAHLLNDWYMNYIQTLLPFLVAAGLTISKGAFLISVFTISSSLVQPYFGYLVDRRNQRWLVYVGTLWMAVLLSLVTVIGNYAVLMVVVALAGFGTAAFHPQASAMVSVIGAERKGLYQSLFVAAGNVGWALTPLMLVPYVDKFGLGSVPVFVILGIAVAIMLRRTAPKMIAKPKSEQMPLLPALKSAWFELSKVVVVVALRSLAYSGLIAFLPLYLEQQNISLLRGSHLISLMLFTGAIGGMVGGFLSDKLNRKVVIIVSLVLASPLFYLFLHTGGIVSYALLALAGAALLASFSITIVVAQESIQQNAAMASGLMLGFGTGIGGLGVGLIGLMIEHVGIHSAISLLIWLPMIAGLFAFSLNNRGSKSAVKYREAVRSM